ncbi:MAG: beta-glucosidase H [Yoonia sp.]
MTLNEQISLMSGEGSWSLPALPQHSVGSLVVTDGPNGARGGGGLLGGISAAAFPVGIALGSTWDPDLMEQVGAALAEETRDKGAHVLLAPTINLQRGPLNGRNFECFSEDPMLTGALAVGYIKGLQDNGVAAVPKHFIANESEIDRAEISSDVDERTLRELYLMPFEQAVKKGGAWAIMSSYNRLNGTFTSEHPWLLNDVLRDDWGFDGVVMSDWYGSHSTVETVLAGLDIEMPGPTRDRGKKLADAVRDGRVPAEQVRNSALNVLRLMDRCGALSNLRPRVETANERPAIRSLIRKAAASGMVLLKNMADTLPLAEGTKIAVIGPNVKTAQIMGGGSSQLKAHRMVSIWDGLTKVLNPNALTYAAGCRNNRFEPILRGPINVDWFDNSDLSGEPATRTQIDTATLFLNRDDFGSIQVDRKVFSLCMNGHFTPSETGLHRIGIHCAGRARVYLDDKLVIDAWDHWERGATFFEEGCDPRTADVELTAGTQHGIRMEFRSEAHFVHDFSALYVGVGKPSTQADIEAAQSIAQAADVAIVCVGRNAEWDTEGWDLPSMDLPGDQDALVSAVARDAKRTIVLLQTGGPVAMPWLDEVDAVIQAWYPGQEAGHAIADVLLGKQEPTGRLPQSFPKSLADAPTMTKDPAAYPGVDGRVRYDEKLEIGYRHHDSIGTAPMFPFGFGLGYGKVVLGAASVSTEDFEATGTLSVFASLYNSGTQDSTGIVQVYVAPTDAPVSRPEKELKAFAKPAVAIGETENVTLDLTARDFAWFCIERQSWIVSPGTYEIRVGFSAENPETIAIVTRDSELVLNKDS